MLRKNCILSLWVLFSACLFHADLLANTKVEKQIAILLKNAEMQLENDAYKALDLALHARQLSDSIQNNKLKGLSSKYVGISHVKLFQHKDAILYLEEAAELLKNYDLPNDKILVYLNLGRAYREDDSYLLAEKALLDCIQLASTIGDIKIQGEVYYMLAKVYRKKSDYLSGLNVCFKCLEIASEVQDSMLMSGCENEVGLVYYNQDKKDDALEFYNLALEKKLKVNDSSGIADIYKNIGNVYGKNNQNIRAIDMYNLALQYLPKQKYQPNSFYIPYNIGIANYNLGKFEEAKAYFTRSLKEANLQNSQSKIADSFIWHARVMMEEGKFSDSQFYLEKALEIAREIGSLDIERNVCFAYYKLYERFERFSEALSYHVKYMGLTRKVFSERSDKRTTEMRLVYETERQEKKIVELQNEVLKQHIEKAHLEKSRNSWIFFTLVAILFAVSILIYVFQKRKGNKLLTDKNRELENAIAKLEESIHTKDKIFTIISHDLKSPFNSILGFSELLMSKSETLSKEKLTKYYEQINKSAKSTYELLKNLLDWARLQLGQISVKKERVDLNELVNLEINNCIEVASKKDIVLDSKIDPDIEIKADSSMLSIVLRNLFTNAIKFSPSKTKVLVKSYQKDDKINITVSDNGIGIPEDKINKLFSFQTNTSTLGTDGEKGTGLGLVLSYELIKLHNGNINVDSKPGKTDFTISFPNN